MSAAVERSRSRARHAAQRPRFGAAAAAAVPEGRSSPLIVGHLILGHGVGHAQWSADPVADERPEVGPGRAGHRDAEKAEAEIRVPRRALPRVPTRAEATESGEDVRFGELHIGIRTRAHVGEVLPEPQPAGRPGEPGGVGREVLQRDRVVVATRQVRAGGEQVPDRGVQAPLPPDDTVGQQQGGEHLRDGADLEERVGVRRGAPTGVPACSGVDAARWPGSHHDPDPPPRQSVRRPLDLPRDSLPTTGHGTE
ncbi:hypothetical protein BFG51_13805 [Dietzia alimentaria]|nr:hypothetical protein BFG51_13805 [Dietzia alimentaria]